MDTKQFPIFIICRDLVTWLTQLISWLEKIDHTNIILVDNNSQFPLLLDFFDRTEYKVLRLQKNQGQHSPWKSGAVRKYADGQYYVVTDSDIVPDQSCPNDVMQVFLGALNRYQDKNKVGFGLLIDDLPEHYQFKTEVLQRHKQFWDQSKKIDKLFYNVPLDTTFALYRPNTRPSLNKSLRSSKPYVARHMPWYQNSTHPTQEIKFFRKRANKAISHWGLDELPARLKREL